MPPCPCRRSRWPAWAGAALLLAAGGQLPLQASPSAGAGAEAAGSEIASVTIEPGAATAPEALRRAEHTEVAPIDTSSRAAVLALFRQVIAPAFAVPFTWTGNTSGCQPGDTASELKDAVVRTLNAYRVLAGLPGNVALNPGSSVLAQHAALMVDANEDISHSPPVNWRCYSTEGAQAAGSSNLSLRIGNNHLMGLRSGPSAMQAYLADVGMPELGHRRWLLYSRLGEVGTGDTSRANALWVLGRLHTTPEHLAQVGIAWPPRGYVPRSPLVADPSHTWSFSLPGADFSQAVVSMRNDRGQNLRVKNLGQLPLTIGDNTLGWTLEDNEVRWSRVPDDTTLQVQLDKVMVNGELRSFQYRVTFFEPS